jgi:uncharacterized protein (DUF983 family)
MASTLPPAPGGDKSQPLLRLLWRALRLRCPGCGGAKIFTGWFAMHATCPACGRRFQRDAGYFLGSIYINYGVTGILVVLMYFSMFFGDVLTDRERLAALTVFVVVFPVWFFRYARALWMAFDEYWDPSPSAVEVSEPGGLPDSR